jgi:hypothetical protein
VQRSQNYGAASPRGRLTERAEGPLHCGPLQRESTVTRFLSEQVANRLTLAEERREPLEKVDTHCGGLDVHKGSVVACRLRGERAGRKQKDMETFGTTTAE